MHNIHIQRCHDFAVITIDRRGTIRQTAAATKQDAIAMAKQHAACRISVIVEDKHGAVIFEREFN